MKCFDDIAAMFDSKYGTNMVNRLVEADGERGRTTVNHRIGRWHRFLDMPCFGLGRLTRSPSGPNTPANTGLDLQRIRFDASYPEMIFVTSGKPLLMTLGLSYLG